MLTASQPVFIPELGRQLTADFYMSWGGRRRVQLHLEDVEEPQKFDGPGIVRFKTKRGTCSVDVETIDQASKVLTFRPLSGDC